MVTRIHAQRSSIALIIVLTAHCNYQYDIHYMYCSLFVLNCISLYDQPQTI
jgi:hypothetical protein